MDPVPQQQQPTVCIAIGTIVPQGRTYNLTVLLGIPDPIDHVRVLKRLAHTNGTVIEETGAIILKGNRIDQLLPLLAQHYPHWQVEQRPHNALIDAYPRETPNGSSTISNSFACTRQQ
jgi:hypothetical protein